MADFVELFADVVRMVAPYAVTWALLTRFTNTIIDWVSGRGNHL